MKANTSRWLTKAVLLLLIGSLVGFYPVRRYHLPRSSEAWSHLENLEAIPTAVDAANVGKMLELFDNRQHYTKYPLFYVVAKAFTIDSPWKAAVFSAVVFSILPLLVFLLARTMFGDTEAFLAGLIVAVTSAFVYTMNFFSGGEPLAVVLLLLALNIHVRTRPLFALPISIAIVFLHPFTSLFLWVFLLIFPLFSEQDGKKEAAFVTAAFSVALMGWILFQVWAGLPLGFFATESLAVEALLSLFLIGAGTSIFLILFRDRVHILGSLVDRVVNSIRLHLAHAIIIMEAILLVLFLLVGVPGTEQNLTPTLVTFYIPLLAAIAIAGLRGCKLEPLTAALVATSVALILIGAVVLPKGIPAYRLAPYGAIALALLMAPAIRRSTFRFVVPLVLAGLAATVYPTAPFYFGFDEQYYPSEEAAIEHLGNATLTGRTMTDVRMEDFVRYHDGLQLLVPESYPLMLKGRDVALVTRNMRELGFYPPGAEWFRDPFKLDLSKLDLGSTRMYDGGSIELFHIPEGIVELSEAHA